MQLPVFFSEQNQSLKSLKHANISRLLNLFAQRLERTSYSQYRQPNRNQIEQYGKPRHQQSGPWRIKQKLKTSRTAYLHETATAELLTFHYSRYEECEAMTR